MLVRHDSSNHAITHNPCFLSLSSTYVFYSLSGESISGLRAQVLTDVTIVCNYRAVARWSAQNTNQHLCPDQSACHPVVQGWVYLNLTSVAHKAEGTEKPDRKYKRHGTRGLSNDCLYNNMNYYNIILKGPKQDKKCLIKKIN